MGNTDLWHWGREIIDPGEQCCQAGKAWVIYVVNGRINKTYWCDDLYAKNKGSVTFFIKSIWLVSQGINKSDYKCDLSVVFLSTKWV